MHSSRNVNNSTFTFVKNKANRIDRLTKNASNFLCCCSGSVWFSHWKASLSKILRWKWTNKKKRTEIKVKSKKQKEFGHYKTSKGTRIVWNYMNHTWKYIVATSMYSPSLAHFCCISPRLPASLALCTYTQSHIDSYVTCHAHRADIFVLFVFFHTNQKENAAVDSLFGFSF